MLKFIAKLLNKDKNNLSLSKKEFKILSYIKISRDAILVDASEINIAKSLSTKGFAVNRGNGKFAVTEKGLLALRNSSYKSHF